MRIRYLAVLTLALAACKPQPETDEAMQARMSAEADSIKPALEALNRSFATHMVAGHADTLAAFYADNATIMAPNMAPAHGSAAIKAALTGMLQMAKPTAFSLRTGSVSANGPLAVESGRYVWTVGTAVDSGKYLVHWHRMNGKWMIVDDIWNSDNPEMPMPAPAPAHGARRS